MALELILRRHDPAVPGQGVPLAQTFIRLLGYTDDVAVTELGDDAGVQKIEERVDNISKGSSDDADMQVNKEKTVTLLHVRTQDKTTPATRDATMSICKFQFPHLLELRVQIQIHEKARYESPCGPLRVKEGRVRGRLHYGTPRPSRRSTVQNPVERL